MISYVPGKLFYAANALSRAPIDEIVTEDDETEAMVQAILLPFPGTNDHLKEYHKAQHTNAMWSMLIIFCRNGWTERSNWSRYWRARGELTVNDNLLIYGTCIVVPESLCRCTLMKVHQGHQGIHCCRSTIFSNEMKDFIKQCPECQKSTTPLVESM